MFDKFINKVSARRSSESSLLELASTRSVERRGSLSSPMIIISESDDKPKPLDLGEAGSHSPRLAQGISLASGSHHTRSRSRSRSRSMSHSNFGTGPIGITASSANGNHSRGSSPTPFSRSPASSFIHGPSSPTKKTTKELIKEETAQIVSKKLSQILKDLGLQQPIPLKTTDGPVNSSSASKSAKFFVANTNDCIYLSPASSASFTYEDVENGNNPSASLDIADLLSTDDDQDNESAILSENEDADPLSPLDILIRKNSDSPRQQRPSFASTTSQRPTSDPNAKNIPRRLEQKLSAFRSPNYLCTKIDSETPIPHTFAVIIELNKDCKAVSDLKIEFNSHATLLWPNNDPYTKTHTREKFKIGSLEWNTNFSDADFFISSSNTNDVKMKKVTPNELAKRTKDYKLVNIRDLANGNDKVNTDNSPSPLMSDDECHKAGLYVFLLPIILPEHIPPTIFSINGSLIHSLNISFSKASDKLNRRVKINGEYNLPIVRTPPSFANSIADKPIYVNRVWNDSLHYIITFPRKYVALGAEHVINIKLVPLVKDVIIKRIRFNVLERITYVSKDLSKEYDYDGDDPFHTKTSSDSKVKERIISLCELKTKHKATANAIGSEPYKEEVVKCPDNNLLYICYENEVRPKSPGPGSAMIASPLDINVALPFLTTKMDKTLMTSSMDEDYPSFSNPTSRKASISVPDSNFPYAAPQSIPFSPIIGALETNLSHHSGGQTQDFRAPNEIFTPESSSYLTEDFQNSSQPPTNIQLGYTGVSRALYPDSNFRHIQIHHRLQVCFRISKPDPKDDYKMHHYEVVVDTPLVLVSAKCSDDSVQLPEYDDLYETSTDLVSTPEAETENSIAFRTPNFEKNGLTIKTFDPTLDSEDQLPSFEEAISSYPSPNTRTFSVSDDPISRIPSIAGAREDVPSYDSIDHSSKDALDDNEITPLNIDELVSESSSSDTPKRSRLRSSLASSFAPPLLSNSSRNGSISNSSSYNSSGASTGLASNESNSQGSDDCTEPGSTSLHTFQGSDEQISEFNPDLVNSDESVPSNSLRSVSSIPSSEIPARSSMDNDSTPTTTVADSSGESQEQLCQPTEEPSSPDIYTLESKDDTSAPLEPSDSTEAVNEEDEDFQSYRDAYITGEETSFSQRLPLLSFVSGETIPTRRTYNPRMSSTATLPITEEGTTAEDLGKYSTDNLSILSTNHMYGLD